MTDNDSGWVYQYGKEQYEKGYKAGYRKAQEEHNRSKW